MGFVRLFLLYAILIFAKKAPKLIMDLLKIKGDGIGLKGLSIKNKMGDAALVGGAVKKGMTGIEGRTKGAIGGAVGGLLRGGKGERLKAAVAGASRGFSIGKHDAKQNGETKGIFSGAFKEMGNIASGNRTSFFSKPGEWLAQKEDDLIKKMPGQNNRFVNPIGAEKQIKLNGLKLDLTKRYGSERADKMLERAIERTKNYARSKGKAFDLADEEQWMYLTDGKIWDGTKYRKADATSPAEWMHQFDGLNHAIENGTDVHYTFDGAVGAEMNAAYRFSNIATNIDKKRAAFDTAYQKHMSAQASNLPSTELAEYEEALKASFKKYCEALDTAVSENLININLDVNNGKINGKDMKEFLANKDGVDTTVSKQVSTLKSNTDAAVQREEIKQKTDSNK